MSEPEFSEKFIAFYDILGWKHHVQASDEGRGMSAGELSEIVAALGSSEDRKSFEKYGPTTCPQAPRIRRDLDFQITLASDSAIVSAEVSPAGLINLVSHCATACMKLLAKGIMCRGIIKRGRIYHTDKQQFGAGLSEAVEREKQVSVFRGDADERGTPFIEVGQDILRYVQEQPDACVKEMFSRMVRIDGDLAAVFPFQRLNHSFIIAGMGRTFDPEKERASVNNVRGWITKMKELVQRHTDQSNPDAVRKGNHYLRVLDAQLAACDKTEEVIDAFSRPFPMRQVSDLFRSKE